MVEKNTWSSTGCQVRRAESVVSVASSTTTKRCSSASAVSSAPQSPRCHDLWIDDESFMDCSTSRSSRDYEKQGQDIVNEVLTRLDSLSTTKKLRAQSPSRAKDTSLLLAMGEDCLVHLLWLLSAEEICRFSTICKGLQEFTNAEHVWQRLCERNYAKDVTYFCGPNRLMVARKPIWKGMYQVLRSKTLELAFECGPEQGELLHVTKKGFTIGRSRGNDVAILQDPLISRNHLVISFHDQRFFIRDVGGTNGTCINGVYLPQYVDTPLHLGDAIELGASRFVVTPRLQVHPRYAIMMSAFVSS
eukprot:CAMPEP_0114561238 /NCGR_PEP_ID=MMETSP0114-20121206/11896_1 /TAXON_ID=31324 /ORGANISM="Goniomonas sp, Strain m" /LENGTH=302 /DNA_ID=CAMNT_0001746857 /DNA_START=15 /DNA_END=923 /DNA_ORIENTATION=+